MCKNLIKVVCVKSYQQANELNLHSEYMNDLASIYFFVVDFQTHWAKKSDDKNVVVAKTKFYWVFKKNLFAQVKEKYRVYMLHGMYKFSIFSNNKLSSVGLLITWLGAVMWPGNDCHELRPTIT